MLKRRTRIVSFRLTEEEYEALFACCVSTGARSLSDYARSAACGPLSDGKDSGGDGKAEKSIRKLRNRVEELDRLVRQLTLEMDSYRAIKGRPIVMSLSDLASPPKVARERAK